LLSGTGQIALVGGVGLDSRGGNQCGNLLCAPGEGYVLRNFTDIQLIIGYLLARIVVSAVFIPAFYHHEVVSIDEFSEPDLGHGLVRCRVGFSRDAGPGKRSRLWVPHDVVDLAAFQSRETLAPMEEFLMTGAALIIVTLATAIYTTVGGIRAVIWTDVLQIVVLLCALSFRRSISGISRAVLPVPIKPCRGRTLKL